MIPSCLSRAPHERGRPHSLSCCCRCSHHNTAPFPARTTVTTHHIEPLRTTSPFFVFSELEVVGRSLAREGAHATHDTTSSADQGTTRHTLRTGPQGPA